MTTFNEQQLEAATKALFEPPELPDHYGYAEMLAEDPERAALWRADAKRVLEAAGFIYAEMVAAANEPCPEDVPRGPDRCTHHEPTQHRDNKPPWCSTCGEV